MAWKNGEMLSGTSGTSDIACPFFSAHGKRAIQCKDIYPGARFIRTDFENEGEKRFHQETYCEGNFKMCWLYRCAMKMLWDE